MEYGFSEIVRFLPWIGKTYGNRQRGRLLLLGESHYRKDKSSPREFTSEVIRDYLNGDRYPFFTKVARLLTADPIVGRSGFWNTVAFYNYIPEIVGDRPRIRPSDAMWEIAKKPFEEVIDVLAPNHIVVVGKTLWDNMSSIGHAGCDLLEGESRRETWEFVTPAGTSVPATWTYHPAYTGFSAEAESIWVRLFLESLSSLR